MFWWRCDPPTTTLSDKTNLWCEILNGLQREIRCYSNPSIAAQSISGHEIRRKKRSREVWDVAPLAMGPAEERNRKWDDICTIEEKALISNFFFLVNPWGSGTYRRLSAFVENNIMLFILQFFNTACIWEIFPLLIQVFTLSKDGGLIYLKRQA